MAVASLVRLATCKPSPTGMPEPWLDRHQRPARGQQPGRLGEAGRQRPLEGDVVHDQAIEHDVETAGREVELAGQADVRLVGALAMQEAGHLGAVGVDGHEPEGRGGKDVASGMPSGADREHGAAAPAQAPGQQVGLPALHVPVMVLERGRAAHAVQEVIGRVGL